MKTRGSVYRRNDGFWVGATSRSVAAGELVRRVGYGASKREARTKLAVLRQEFDNAASPNALRLSVSEYLECWLEEIVKPSCKPYTYINAGYLLRRSILPYLGKVRLASLSPLSIQAFFGQLEKAGVPVRSRQSVHYHLRWALNHAVRTKLLLRNPCLTALEPKAPPRERPYLTPAEAKRFLRAAKQDPYYALYALAIASGMRIGELLGLLWEDVNLDSGTVFVRRALYELKGKKTMGTPKSASAYRRIELPPFAVAALQEYRRSLEAAEKRKPYVFVSPRGHQLHQNYLRTKSLPPLLAKARITKKIRFHDLRHTTATLLAAEGIHPKVISERLGHARAATTLNTYTHPVEKAQKDIAKKLEALLQSLKVPSEPLV